MEQNAQLLDPRLRFPVHALLHERVVWAGSAALSAYGAAIVRLLLFVALLMTAMMLPFSSFGVLGASRCQVSVEARGAPPRQRECTEAERAKEAAAIAEFRSRALRLARSGFLLILLGYVMGLALRRRHLAYVVTNERVVVQDGYLGIRVGTIDLDHVVSITAKAGLVERWFGVKSVSVTVPGQKAAIWQRGAMLANAIELWGLPAQDPALSQLLNVWLPRSRG